MKFKPIRAMKKTNLIAHVHSEQYCCMAGYLNLCRARKETAVEMADNFTLSPVTIWKHYRKLAAGKHKCESRQDCLKQVIAEITEKSLQE